jgi:hypothetical protein
MNYLKARFTQYSNLLYPLLLLTIFYTFAARHALRTQPVEDVDLWWHLRTGQWIMEHHALPVTDPFSQVGQGQAWVAYSWLFEVLLYALFKACGLMGVIGYTAVLSLAIVVALLAYVQRFVPNYSRAVLYVGMGALTLAPLCSPRPWLFTLLFFIIEYTLLVAARQTGKTRWLWCLPLIFALWANLHIQFIYGLFLLGFDTVQPWLEQLLRRDFSLKKLRENFDRQRWALLLVCCGATLATPYQIKIYQAMLEIAGQRRVYEFVTELQPLSFNSPMPWWALALTLWAVFRLGWQRLAQPSLLVLLLIGVFLAFRSTRDVWFLIVIALGILAATSSVQDRAGSMRVSIRFAVLPLACLALYGFAQRRQLNNQALQSAVDAAYPAAAARVIEERGYTGPLYNHFNWGGYLIWRLPHLPVSMDGRTNLYGGERIAHHTAIWDGDRRWAQDRELAAAGLVICNINQPLCELLRYDQRFELVYEDQLAAVFRARNQALAGKQSTAKQALSPALPTRE